MSDKCETILDTAKGLITGNRRDVYGTARDDFTRTGKLWEQVLGIPVGPEKVAMCMALVKIGRLTNSPDHEDSWIDICGYAALGGEIATTQPEESVVDCGDCFYVKPCRGEGRSPAVPVTVDRLTEAEKDYEWETAHLRYRWRDGAWWLNAKENGPNLGWQKAGPFELGFGFTRAS